jgi:hypothetical protein
MLKPTFPENFQDRVVPRGSDKRAMGHCEVEPGEVSAAKELREIGRGELNT